MSATRKVKRIVSNKGDSQDGIYSGNKRNSQKPMRVNNLACFALGIIDCVAQNQKVELNIGRPLGEGIMAVEASYNSPISRRKVAYSEPLNGLSYQGKEELFKMQIGQEVRDRNYLGRMIGVMDSNEGIVFR